MYYGILYRVNIKNIPPRGTKIPRESHLCPITVADFEYILTYHQDNFLSHFFSIRRKCGVKLGSKAILFTTRTLLDQPPWEQFKTEPNPPYFVYTKQRHFFFLFAFPRDDDGNVETGQPPTLSRHYLHEKADA